MKIINKNNKNLNFSKKESKILINKFFELILSGKIKAEKIFIDKDDSIVFEGLKHEKNIEFHIDEETGEIITIFYNDFVVNKKAKFDSKKNYSWKIQ